MGVGGVVFSQKLEDTWAVGARLGYLVAPNVLSYVNGGYTGANWSGATIVGALNGAPFRATTNSFTPRDGSWAAASRTIWISLVSRLQAGS